MANSRLLSTITYLQALYILLLRVPTLTNALAHRQSQKQTCRLLPGDSGWPDQSAWSALNQTVGGRLIATVPIASVCHDAGVGADRFNVTECSMLKAQWDFPRTFEQQPGDIMNPYFQAQSCDPFTETDRPCELGNYASYSISVSGADDVVAGIKFAKQNNVRLVIKNTGHDFLGKSTAKGALALWTRNLKSTTVIPSYKSEGYSGPAIRLGAGVVGYEALEAAHDAGYSIVTGECPTVGVAGGYSQGGGHSPLNGAYGMAADQVLEWEVVTADGRQVTATPTENSDLYWALSGGGAGTFAVVLSMTTKIHPETPVGSATFSFLSASVDRTTYIKAIQAWWASLPAIVDTGAVVIYVINADAFAFTGFTALNKTAEQVTQILQPFLSQLDALKVPYNFAPAQVDSYYTHFNQTNGPLPYGGWPTTMLFNSRFIPRALVESSSDNVTASDSISTLTAAFDKIVHDRTDGASWNLGCNALNARLHQKDHADNAVVSYWRDAIAMCITISLWDWTVPRAEMLARKQYLGEVIAPTLEESTPGGGAYLNEADPMVYPVGSMEWKEKFYGNSEHYQRLRAVKDKWDAEGVFYAYTAVGSEDWAVDGDGRLCRV